MKAIRKYISGPLLAVTRILLIILMIIMVISMFIQVLTRWLGISVAWTEEMTRFACIWLIFLGSSFLSDYDGHINVTILDSVLKKNPKALRILSVVRKLIFIAFSLIIGKVGIDASAMVMRQTSPNMGIPMNFMYICIPIGAFLTALYLIINLFVKPEAQSENKEEVQNG
ncbi:MAG: TRAP transporter small permease [Clostridia bacterium]|nr:TRAP transporter small permease [Clostridia bacterium]